MSFLDSVAKSEQEALNTCSQRWMHLVRELGIDTADVRTYIEANKTTSRYYVLAKRLEYEQIEGFKELQKCRGLPNKRNLV